MKGLVERVLEIFGCLGYAPFLPKISNALFPPNPSNAIGLLHNPITWYKISFAELHVIR